MSLENEIFEISQKSLGLLSTSPEEDKTRALCFVPTLAALLYNVMRLRPHEPDYPDRDRLICPGLPVKAACLAALAQRGFSDVSGLLSDDALCALSLPGMDAAAERAGQGMALAVDSAIKARNDIKIYRSFLLITQEDCLRGELWEHAIRASENMLEDLCVILCRRRDDVFSELDNICAKFSAFGFDTLTVDGSSADAVSLALLLPRRSHKPAFVCCEL